MRLGILGGTFDPIHFGHLRVAEEMVEEMKLEKIYLIPGALPPHKDRKPITPFHHRLAMTQMAAQDSPVLETLDLEGRRQGFSYTIETLKEIRQIHRSNLELFFIIGMANGSQQSSFMVFVYEFAGEGGDRKLHYAALDTAVAPVLFLFISVAGYIVDTFGYSTLYYVALASMIIGFLIFIFRVKPPEKEPDTI